MYEEYEDYDLQENRHRKIKKSTAVKTKKSKHKHIYVDCVFSIPYDFLGRDRITYVSGQYCSICGKTVIGSLINGDVDGETIELDSWFQKSIDLEKG